MCASMSRIWCAQPNHSCSTANGTASIRCMRPVLITSIHAVGKVSFDDCSILTSSLGCTVSLLPILPPSNSIATVRQHLVGVHVRLRAGPGLPDAERKMVVELAGDRLVGGANDGLCLPLRQPPGRGVDQRSRLLDIAIGAINSLRHPVVADREIHQAALRLRSPIAVGRDFDFAHRVGFAPGSSRTNANRDIVRFGMGLVIPVIAPPAPSGAAQCNFTGGPVRRDRARASSPNSARGVPCNARSCSVRSERYMTPAKRPSMKKPRPKTKPIRFPTVLCLPRETSDPKSRYE